MAKTTVHKWFRKVASINFQPFTSFITTALNLQFKGFQTKSSRSSKHSVAEMSFARQADYDQLVKEMVSEGASVEEASAEAQDVFRGSGYDLGALYLYETGPELKEKELTEQKFRTLEDKSALNNYVNSHIAIKFLEKLLTSSGASNAVVGTLKLAESRKLGRSLLNIVALTVSAEAEEESDDEDDEDADENKITQKTTLLGFTTLLLQKAAPVFLNYLDSIALSEENVVMLCKVMDVDSGEPRIVDKLMDLLQLLCAHDENRRLFSEKGMVALLDLAAKMNKKNAGICSKAAQLSALLQ